MVRLTLLSMAAALALVGASCDSGSSSCGVAGMTQSCVCAGGLSGAQSCLATGEWGSCDCGASGSCSANSCGAHGDCVDGACDCVVGYGGASCEQCAPGFSGYPTCVTTGCTPNCAGKECGDDGCGGTCSPGCAGNEVCASGSCQCTPDCAGAQCGGDGCGGSCGTCGANEACNGAGSCVCSPSCVGNPCGDDGCGGSCGTCVGAYAGTMTVSGQFNIENTGGPFTCTGSLTFTVTAAGKIEPAGECTFTATGSNQPVIISVSGAPFDYAADSTFDGSIDVGVQVPNLSKGTTKSAKMKGQFKSKTALEATLSTPFGDTFNLGSNPTTTAKLQGGTFTGSK